MTKFFFEKIVNYSFEEIKEICFGMYSCIQDPQKQERKYTKEGMLIVKLNRPIIDKNNCSKQSFITEGMLYKIIESPIHLLLKDDIGSMIEMCKHHNHDISINSRTNEYEAASPISSGTRQSVEPTSALCSNPSKASKEIDSNAMQSFGSYLSLQESSMLNGESNIKVKGYISNKSKFNNCINSMANIYCNKESKKSKVPKI